MLLRPNEYWNREKLEGVGAELKVHALPYFEARLDELLQSMRATGRTPLGMHRSWAADTDKGDEKRDSQKGCITASTRWAGRGTRVP